MKIKRTDLSGEAYRVGFFFVDTPVTAETLAMHVFTDDVTFADDFAGSVASVGVDATATFVLDVLKEGVSVGSISISTLGVATFSTTSGTVAFATGETIKIVGPVTIDDTIQQVAVTLVGTIDG